jgi:phosphohistidine phosphatase
MRHAEAQSGGVSDAARELTARGRRDARALGAWLGDQPFAPDRILCSDAVRAHQTLVAMELPRDTKSALDERLYLAPPARLLEVIRGAESDARSLLVLAHNPGVADLALQLASNGPASSLQKLALGFAAATLAALEVLCAWSEIEEARLVEVMRPVDLPKSGP